MIVIKSSADGSLLRRRTGGRGLEAYVTNFLGYNRHVAKGEAAPEPGVLYPTAHLIEQDGGTSLAPHFHIANQFQVAVAGSGLIGKMPVRTLQVHYTNAGTPYGPIHAGPDGLAFYTLRNSYDPGSQLMPDSRDELKAFPGRQHRYATSPAMDPVANLAGLPDVTETVMIEACEDGLGSWLYRIPAGKSVVGPDPSAGGGQYWVVTGGKLARDSEKLPRNSCLFVSPDEAPFTAMASDEGVEILVMQYPKVTGAVAIAA